LPPALAPIGCHHSPTAWRAACVWIPNNRFIADSDSREDAIAYITRLSDGRAADPSLIEVYVDFEWNAEMVKTFIGYEVKPMTSWTNTGDGHLMGMGYRAGRHLAGKPARDRPE
jgi:hypothetical protein